MGLVLTPVRSAAIVVTIAASACAATHAWAQFYSLPIEQNESVAYTTSIALDAAGNPHIAYFDRGANDLVYMTRQAGTWRRQIVDVGGSQPSIAIAPDGTIGISYWTPIDGVCRYAFLSDTTWINLAVHFIPNNIFNDLTFAQNSEPRIALYETARHRVYYAYPAGFGFFARDTVDQVGDPGYYVSLAHDGSDNPHMIYFTAGHELRDAHRTAGWTITPITTVSFRGPTDLKIDALDNLHVTYFDRGTNRLIYAMRTGSTWSFDTVITFPGTFALGYHSLALDPTGQPVIAYFDPNLQALRLARRTGSTWTFEDVDSSIVSGEYCSLAIGSSGSLAISYNHNDGGFTFNGDLRFAESPGSGWTVNSLDGAAGDDFGRFASLALEATGDPSYPNWHMAYYDASNRWLRYAFYNESLGSLSFDYPDRSAETGQYADVARSSLTPGMAYISYYDATNGHLKYTQGSPGSWAVAAVDNTGDVGRHTSIAMDGTPQPHISYYDVTGGDLKYAYRDGSGWHPVRVDSIGDVGRYSSLALNAAGRPRIAYYDATNGDLKFASNDGAGWSSAPVFTTGDVGQYASLALNASGRPRIATFDATNADLLFFSDDGAGWQMEPVDAFGDVGRFCSLSIASDGTPCIAYYDSTFQRLKYARRQDGQWYHRYVEDPGYPLGAEPHGWYPALALMSNDSPKMLYFHQTRGDLMAMYAGPTTLAVTAASIAIGPRLNVAPNPMRLSGAITGSGWTPNSEVELSVYDISGRRVARLSSRVGEAGTWQARWSSIVDQGGLPVGLYLVRAGDAHRTSEQKVVVLR